MIKSHADGVAVYTSGELGHKFVFDFDALDEALAEARREGYEKGLAEGKRKADNTDGTAKLLSKVDNMAHQVEEAHAALRRRNETIRGLENRITKLERDIIEAKLQNYREARAEAWNEGWKHDNEYLNAFGQFCRDCKCNPYAKED